MIHGDTEHFDYLPKPRHNTAMSLRVAIVGPTGYTGLCLIELLQRHPAVSLTYLASRREEITDITDVFPRLRGTIPGDVARCRAIDASTMAAQADLVFVALPHRVAMAYVPALLEAGLRVIDLSADYRLNDAAHYEAVYGQPHVDKGHLTEAVYGLPEHFRQNLSGARLVANPGCYPTAAALAILPLLKAGLVRHDGIVINAASGATGAGIKPAPHLHFPEQNEAFGPYGRIGAHRHQSEIEQTLSTSMGRDLSILFVPHLLPINRGILETIYLEPVDRSLAQMEHRLMETLREAYREEPFVRVVDGLPNVRHVAHTNFCDVTARVVGPKGSPRVVLFSVIDNMIKGASGQAVQNMNILFGLKETVGLLPSDSVG